MLRILIRAVFNQQIHADTSYGDFLSLKNAFLHGERLVTIYFSLSQNLIHNC